jgi:Family of unknown function (DUF6155)
MASSKKSASWRDIKRVLASKSQNELLNVIRDLYALRPEVKDFMHARFLTSEASLEPYKKIIEASLYPDVMHGDTIELSRGRKAISDYKKATNDPIGTLDLMVYYVERGTRFTVDYGDIDAWFYESLESMFSQVVKTLQQSDEETIDHFLPRLESIVHRAYNIGWGYYDTISDMLKKAFPE